MDDGAAERFDQRRIRLTLDDETKALLADLQHRQPPSAAAAIRNALAARRALELIRDLEPSVLVHFPGHGNVSAGSASRLLLADGSSLGIQDLLLGVADVTDPNVATVQAEKLVADFESELLRTGPEIRDRLLEAWSSLPAAEVSAFVVVLWILSIVGQWIGRKGSNGD
jgi:hypothetical protein